MPERWQPGQCRHDRELVSRNPRRDPTSTGRAARVEQVSPVTRGTVLTDSSVSSCNPLAEVTAERNGPPPG